MNDSILFGHLLVDRHQVYTLILRLNNIQMRPGGDIKTEQAAAKSQLFTFPSREIEYRSTHLG